ncbi:MAG: methyltransferase domain-containing protein [Acidimicrobiales bacterium]
MSEWETTEGEHWAANADRYTRSLSGYGAILTEALALTPGERVLDVGCGCGDISVAAGRAVGDGGAVHGVDLSAAMLAVAEARARAASLDQVRFSRADAAVWQPDDGPLDVATSRFGVMFFEDPVAAFANIHTGLRPGGRLVFLCWRDLTVNDWLFVPGAAVAEVLPLPVGEPGAPGAFALADGDRLAGILATAGFTDVELDEAVAPMWMGRDVDDAVGFLRTTGMGRSLFADAPNELVAEATARAAAALAPHEGADGVVLGGTAWLVRATA